MITNTNSVRNLFNQEKIVLFRTDRALDELNIVLLFLQKFFIATNASLKTLAIRYILKKGKKKI